MYTHKYEVSDDLYEVLRNKHITDFVPYDNPLFSINDTVIIVSKNNKTELKFSIYDITYDFTTSLILTRQADDMNTRSCTCSSLQLFRFGCPKSRNPDNNCLP